MGKAMSNTVNPIAHSADTAIPNMKPWRAPTMRAGSEAALGTAAAFGFPAPTLAQGISGEIDDC